MGSYSSTPLYKKLGLKDGLTAYTKNSPRPYIDFFDEMPVKVHFIKRISSSKLDFIHLFVKRRKKLEQDYLSLYQSLAMNGIMWISWPKGSSQIETDLNREYIREYVLDNGLVDVKVASIDDDWSALKFVYRLKDRK